MVWSYRLEKKAEKDLQRLPKTIQQRVLDFLYLRADKDPFSLARALVNTQPTAHRFRAGDYRITVYLDNAAQVGHILRIQHRKDIYRP